MAYTLTLTRDDRRAIDWIGGRYRHGDELFQLLCDCRWEAADADGAEDWDSHGGLTFHVPEYVAWELSDIIDADGLACFGRELCDKLRAFQGRIV
jgi:hypothetical protein